MNRPQPRTPQPNKTIALAMAALFLGAAAATLQAAVSLVPERIASEVADRQDFQLPDRVNLSGWVGCRVAVNESNRLAKLDPDRLLEGYRKRPGRQSWDGEHVGKWLHAATLAWVNTGDPALRQKLDVVAAELVKCQLADGYLGTYLDKDRWTEWDVWAHKYNLIGLITYMRFTGNMDPLPACRRMGDLLCATFGDAPGKRDIIRAGHHVGLAPTSVLEPMVLLYRLTGEQRYLEFCDYILRAWEQPNGPKVISTLLTVKRVDKVGNGKAYEMLSCLNGVLEYYRTLGDHRLLEACLNAWQDIVDNRLYLTGASSYGELFHDDFDLPNVGNVGETCVTVTWLQFNAQLLRLTGEARFADQLERVILNQLMGAQKPDGSAWGYYVEMEGRKPYSSNLEGHCCLSSGPRGIALIPTFAVTTDPDGVVLNLYDAAVARLSLHDRTPVAVDIEGAFPFEGRLRIRVDSASRKPFMVKLRKPAWCPSTLVRLNGTVLRDPPEINGYLAITRSWHRHEIIELEFALEPRLIVGDHLNEGKIALLYGPLVLAADEALLGFTNINFKTVGVEEKQLPSLDFTPEPAPSQLHLWPEELVFRINGIVRRATGPLLAGARLPVRMIPFADAGASGTEYKIWLPIGLITTPNLFFEASESRSRRGNLYASITDGNPATAVCTYDGKTADEDWFAVAVAEPVTITRVIFAHGITLHDGGWFDTSAGKPKIQAKSAADAQWETLGELQDYPATTATDPGRLKDGQAFTFKLPTAAKIVALRVVGKPACGDNPQQAFSSCAELQAFKDK
ncbi:MAG: glycoside hydrolase family 127 protein [Limisphaerales bacterium]